MMEHLPHNIEAEQALLGSILVNNNTLDLLPADFYSGHFYDPVHARIYEAIENLSKGGNKVSPASMKRFFNGELITDDLSAGEYLKRLTIAAEIPSVAKHFAEVIKSDAVYRGVVEVGQELVYRASHPEPDQKLSDIAQWAESELYKLTESKGRTRQAMSLEDAMLLSIEAANEAYVRGNEMAGLPTGLVDLDKKLGGLVDSNLVVIGGRPAMGKSALALNIALHNAQRFLNEADDIGKRPKSVAFFSLEMSERELADRALSEKSGISSYRIKNGQFEENEFKKVVETAKIYGNLPLKIDATGGLSISQLALRARRMKRQDNLGLVIVDYLQLMRGNGYNSGNKVQEITDITNGLKALAKELNVPVVALSQLSRKVESREDKRPLMSDLRESGSVEQDADVILFCYREEYYLQQNEPPISDQEKHQQWQDNMRKAHGAAEIIIGKQRHGPSGIIRCAYDASLTKFSDLAKGA